MDRPLNIFVPHCSDLLTDSLPHGDGLIAHGFISSLARRGHRLHVAAQRVELLEPLGPNVAIYPINSGQAGGVSARLEYMLRVRSLFRRLSKNIEFDLIHQLNPVFTGMSLSLYGSRVPLVLGTYVARWPKDPDALGGQGQWNSRVLTRMRDAISAFQQRQAKVLLLTTPAAWNRLPNVEEVHDRIHTLPHGIDTKLFSPISNWDSAEQVQADQAYPSVLFFANVFKRKGICTLIDAFPAVAEKFPNSKLQIAGDGPELPEVKKRVANLKCGAQVEFRGRQDRGAAPDLYRNCTVYCLPSFGEPYATTVIEAMSCARPIVVSDSGGLPYMVKERGGRCVSTGDANALSNALIELLENPAVRVSMGRYNRNLVETTMSWDMVAKQLEGIYESTVVNSSKAKSYQRQPRQLERGVGAKCDSKSKTMEVA